MSRSSFTGGASAVKWDMRSPHGLDGAGRIPVARRQTFTLIIGVKSRPTAHSSVNLLCRNCAAGCQGPDGDPFGKPKISRSCRLRPVQVGVGPGDTISV